MQYKDAVVVSTGDYNKNAQALIKHLKNTSEDPVIVLYDKKYDGSKIPPPKASVSHKNLLKKYGSKMKNFAGRWPDNPAKLGAIDWLCRQNTYNRMWHFEDDVYIRNVKDFSMQYKTNDSDFLCKFCDKLPFWYHNGWRVGDKKKISKLKDFKFCELYAYRITKNAAKCITETIKNSKTTNHHEIFYPYAISQSDFTYCKLLPAHLKYIMPRCGTSSNGHSIETIQNKDCEICHPMKTYAN